MDMIKESRRYKFITLFGDFPSENKTSISPSFEKLYKEITIAIKYVKGNV
jgi:hypothetical protein